MLAMTAIGLGSFLAVINVRYRDVPYAVPFLVQLWLFASGVIYAADALPEKYMTIASLNPAIGAITGFRWAVAGTPPPTATMLGLGVAMTAGPLLLRALVLPARRAALRGHAMSTVVAEGISKRYRIGEYKAGYETLRDTLSHAARRALRLEHVDHSLEELWALKDVSFTIEEGEVVGFIGKNGSGKSTLLKILTRITPPTEGTASIRGRVGSILEVGTGLPSRS